MDTSIETQYMPSIIIRDIDEDLRRKFRIICLNNNISMNQQLKEMITEFVEREEKRQQKEK